MAKHWLWNAYIELGDNLTADQAIERLEQLFPSQPVRDIVRAMGNTSQLGQPAQGSAGDPSGTQAARNVGQATAAAQPPAGPKRLTAEEVTRLQAGLAQLAKQEGTPPAAAQAAQPPPDDFNAQLRARAGLRAGGNVATQRLTAAAIRGEQEPTAGAGDGDDFNAAIRRRAMGG